MFVSRPILRLISPCGLLLMSVFFTGCDSEPPTTLEMLPAMLEQRLPFDGVVFDVLADDFDSDGQLDLAFTSHSQSYTQIFYQRNPRAFEAGPKIEEVGFHPGDLMRIPSEDGPLFLMSAEGSNALRVFEPAADGALALVSELGAPSPRVATVFNWSDGALNLAVGPFGRNTIVLVTEFDPATGKRGVAYQLPLESALSQIHQVAAADLTGDGIDEIVFPEPRTNRIYVIRAPKGDDVPAVETLWTFDGLGWPRNVTLVDFDQDGDIDLLVPDEVANPDGGVAGINALMNNGGGGFAIARIPFPTRDGAPVRGVRSIAVGLDRHGNQLMLAASETDLALMQIPQGWSGEPVESRLVSFARREGIRRMLMTDVDGDGHLDAVIGLTGAADSGLLLWGPLPETFDAYDAAGKTIN